MPFFSSRTDHPRTRRSFACRSPQHRRSSNACRRAHDRASPRFTLIETMTAMSIFALVGGTLLASMAATTTTSQDAVDRAIALGMAQQLLDEICGMKYAESLGTRIRHRIGPGSPEVAPEPAKSSTTSTTTTASARPSPPIAGASRSAPTTASKGRASQLPSTLHVLHRLEAAGRRFLCERLEPLDASSPAARRAIGRSKCGSRRPEPTDVFANWPTFPGWWPMCRATNA